MIRTIIDLELKKMLCKELNTLREYEEMLDSMSTEEKEELREWMAHGNSVNSNPYLFYEENGCLMDLIAASRVHEDMCRNPDDYIRSYREEPDDLVNDVPF